MDKKQIEQQYDIPFDNYFSEDLKLLALLQQNGLVAVTPNTIEVPPKGHLLIRNICMCFDIYMRQVTRQQQFSRVI